MSRQDDEDDEDVDDVDDVDGLDEEPQATLLNGVPARYWLERYSEEHTFSWQCACT